jgi:hypothetical protein
MMHGREKSDPAMVAKKRANNAGQAAAERVERTAGTEGNAGQKRTRGGQDREGVSQALERLRTAARFCRHYPRWEPDARKPHVRFWAGEQGNLVPYRHRVAPVAACLSEGRPIQAITDAQARRWGLFFMPLCRLCLPGLCTRVS